MEKRNTKIKLQAQARPLRLIAHCESEREIDKILTTLCLKQ